MIRRAIAAAFVIAAWLLPAGTAATEPLRDSRPPDATFAPVALGPLEDVVPVPVPSRPAVVDDVLGIEGVASWMPERYGRDYVALPLGPGWRFRVCGVGGCWESISTDAGPDLAMQRAGRVIDLAVGRWVQVCGLEPKYGLCPVTVTILGRAKP